MAKSIKKDVKEKVLNILEEFNKAHNTSFRITFRGQFAYLAKVIKQDVVIPSTFRQRLAAKRRNSIKNVAEHDAPIIETKLGRLKYNGSMHKWSFAVFRYSNEIYDPNEFFFPGANNLDGTIEGALQTGLELYP